MSWEGEGLPLRCGVQGDPFFSPTKTAAHEVFFCEKNGSMDIHSLGFSIGGGFKKKEGSPFILGRFPFLTTMFQLGGDHQLIRWIFLRNVEVG